MNIDTVRFRLQSYSDGDDALRARCDQLIDELVARNRFNIEALLSTTSVDLHTRDLSEYKSSEDYELGMTYKNDSDSPDELPTYDAVEERIEALKESRENTRSRRRKDALSDLIEGWKRALSEPNYDEIYWNRIWRPFGDDINLETARALGFGIITFDNDHDSNLTYIGLQGCGQDMTPALMAYIAIEHRVVDIEHVHYLTRPDDVQWARHIIGDAMLIRVYHSLDALPAAILCDLGRDRRKINGQEQNAFTKKARAYAKEKGIKIPKLLTTDPAYGWVKRFKCRNA